MPRTKRQHPREVVRQARTDLYRQHILAAAEQVFAEHGFESAKLQDISALVGLSMGTIYAVFPSKGDLYQALVEERGGRILELVRGVVARNGGPHETLNALIEAYIDFFVSNPNFLRMHLRAGTSWVLSPSFDADRRVKLWKEIHTLQEDIFRRGIRAGVFIDEDPGYLAKLFSAMDQVLLADWVDSGMKAQRAELVARLQKLIARTFSRA
jgi:AcrR family transcriptional regulator